MKGAEQLRYLLPRPWRDTVMGDLEEEARAHPHRGWWLAWHIVRAAWRLQWTIVSGAVSADVRYAVRALTRTPWFTAGAALTFMVGFGVNLATFSVVDRILFRPAPYGDPSRLVALLVCQPGTSNCYNNFPDQLFQMGRHGDLRTLGEFASVSLATRYDVSGSPTDLPPLRLEAATPNLLRALNVRPVVGRGPTEEEGRDAVSAAVVSYESWNRRFGGSVQVLGQIVGNGSRQARIIGVLPHGFIPPSPGLVDPTWDGLVFATDAPVFAPVARLVPGATVASAQAEVSTIVAGLKPTGRRGRIQPIFVRVVPIRRALFQMLSDSAWMIVAVVALLLLMASANLTSLMQARGQSRERECALRVALGASTARVVFTAVIEALLVCAAGASLAWLALTLASDAFRRVLPPVFARYVAAPSDVRVAAFTVCAAIGMTVIAGIWPGLRVARTDVIAALGQAASVRSQSRLVGGRTLVMLEAALGIAVVLVAVLTTTSFSVLVHEGTGYRPDNLYLVQAAGTSPTSPEQILGQYRRMLSAAATTPGVVGVAGGDSLPTNGATALRSFSNDPAQRGGRYELSAGALAMMGTHLLAGREFTPGEVDGDAAVAMLNEGGARIVAAGVPLADLVGREIRLKDEPARRIVGIVPALRSRFGQPAEAAIYVPLGTKPGRYGEFLVRFAPGVRPDVTLLSQRLTEAVGAVRVSLSSVSSALDVSLVEPRFRAVFFVAIAICGLVLAAAGLYALTAFEVSRRTRELGIRLALGASGRRIHWFMATDVLWPVLVGTSVGLLVAWWVARFIRAFLYQVDATAPSLYAVATMILVAIACVTVLLPVRRAARVDPAVTLRVT